MSECRKIGGCPTGQAVITAGGSLKARYVIHTVGPVYQGGGSGEAALLKSAYLESLKLASARGLKSLAFPAISTGVYAYPLEEAARIALRTAMDYLGEHGDLDLVRFVLFSRKMYDVFAGELKKLIQQP
jgi:O-acetyl-ADP-ribose deacetylase (regulator of RNase III)